jgi:DNA-binding response OmpR family regulator
VRALVVEDEAVLGRQLVAALADAGNVVDCAADGVLLDLGLPGMDGLSRKKLGPEVIATVRGFGYRVEKA